MLELASIYNTKIQRLTRSNVYRHMQIKHVKSHLINNFVSLYIFDRENKKDPEFVNIQAAFHAILHCNITSTSYILSTNHHKGMLVRIATRTEYVLQP